MSTMYLYGVAPTTFKDMPYKDALQFKLEQAKKLYSKLYLNRGDEVRKHYVWKALTHTENLLQELEAWD